MSIAGTDEKGRPIFRDIIDPNGFPIRQKLIEGIQNEIEKEFDAALIIYTANLGHILSGIMIQDSILFEDILISVSDKKKGLLMLTSPGGDPNAAEKLVQMCRERFTEGFEIIVPYYAKSAATLMCLCADKIRMGYGAELGPIDPQVQMLDTNRLIPARAYIDGLDEIRRKVKEENDPIALYYPMLKQIRPEFTAICEAALKDSESTAKRYLTKYMFRNNEEQASNVAKWLSDGKTYKSHGKPIDFHEARDVLKLNVEEIDKGSMLWQKMWELLTRSVWMLQTTGNAKLFESKSNSLSMAVKQSPPAPTGSSAEPKQ